MPGQDEGISMGFLDDLWGFIVGLRDFHRFFLWLNYDIAKLV